MTNVKFMGLRYFCDGDTFTRSYKKDLIFPLQEIKKEVGDIFKARDLWSEFDEPLERKLDSYLQRKLEIVLGHKISGVTAYNYVLMLDDMRNKAIRIKITRKDKSIRDTEIMYDRNSEKYCFVNLTTHHVCKCRFDTPEEALSDLLRDDFVEHFEVTKYESET